jgi:hypothetical protein
MRKPIKEYIGFRSRHCMMVLILIFLAGCGILGSNGSPSLKIETDLEVYDLNDTEFINVDIVNTSEQTIYYSTCLARELEILNNGELVDTVPFGVCYCICSATLEPGEQVAPYISKTSTYMIKERSDQLQSKGSVTYRLKYSFYEDKAWGEKLLPQNELQSNEFTLIFPE